MKVSVILIYDKVTDTTNIAVFAYIHSFSNAQFHVEASEIKYVIFPTQVHKLCGLPLIAPML